MKHTPKKTKWFTHYDNLRQPDYRVFAFPYSGAGTSIFFQWSQAFSAQNIELVGVQLPGREDRLLDQPIDDLTVLTEQLAAHIEPLLDKPLVFFGHSLGSLVAFELARALHEKGLSLPQHLIMSAFRSPEQPSRSRALHNLPENELIEELRKYAGTPDEILDTPELMAIFLPALRADFKLHETYVYQNKAPLPCSITTLYGNDDHIVPYETMRNWKDKTSACFKEISYEGDHFFLNQHRANIINTIKDILVP